MIEARDRVGGRVWSAPFGEDAVVERGAEFILPGYDLMNELAARFGIPRVLKGTPYGRRVPVGYEAVPPEDLEAALEKLRGVVRPVKVRPATPSHFVPPAHREPP